VDGDVLVGVEAHLKFSPFRGSLFVRLSGRRL
jgi:hypothetical protein